MTSGASMQVAFGLKAHSGWAALVVVGRRAGRDGRPEAFELIDRRRLDLLDSEDMAWAKQPYHAAEDLPRPAGERLIARALAAVRRGAARVMHEATGRTRKDGNAIAGCAVLSGAPMPDWSVEEILSVHLRMHQAEGVLFREALARAAAACGVPVQKVPEKSLHDHARQTLGPRHAAVVRALDALGKKAGPPWGKDQKDAALAAMLAWCG